MYEFYRIFKMDVKNLFTNPMWLFYTIGFPFLLVLVLGFLTSGTYGNAVSSYDYYGPAMMVYSSLNAATLAANSFMEARIKGPNMRLIYTPVPSFFIYFSKILATFVFTGVCYTFTAILLHVVLGTNWGGSLAIWLWILMLILNFFASSFSVLMCCILKSEEAVNQSVSNIITLMCLLGGVFFPIHALGSALGALSNISPVKWVLETVFQILYDTNFTLYTPLCLILAGLSVLCIVGCTRKFRTEDYL